MDVLSWDERSVLTDHGFLPAASFDRLDRPGSEIDLIDRYRGALVGLAIGDALGKPIDGLDAKDVAARHGRVNRYLSPPLRSLLLPAGQFSSNTQLALMTASNAVTKGRLEPRDLAQRIQAWLPIARVAGTATTAAARSLRNGMPWTNSGQVSSGGGALSRAVVVAMITPFDLDGIRTNAALQTVTTHADHSAIAASVATAATVSHLLATPRGAFSPEALLAVIERSLAGVTDPVVDLRHMAASTTLVERLRRALESDHLSPAEAYASFGTRGFVLESLPMALWAFAHHAGNPVATIIVAVSGGGAASTVGGLAGAFAGAYHGVEPLPPAWIDHLEYVDGLAGHADALAAMSGAGDAPEPFRRCDVLLPDTYAPFSLGGTHMPTLEHAIRSAAATDPTTAVKVRLVPTPADARRYAALSPQRPDWQATAQGTVSAILKRRFADHDPAWKRLDEAGPHEIRQAASLFMDEPFDYMALLEEQRSMLAQR